MLSDNLAATQSARPTDQTQPASTDVAPTARRVARVFVALAFCIGVLFAVINPPFVVNDERAHMARVYELSQGRLITKVDVDHVAKHEMPARYTQLVRRYVWVPRTEEKRLQVSQLVGDLRHPVESLTEPPELVPATAALYAPVAYLPHLPVVWLARVTGAPLLWGLYAARLASVTVYALLAGWAVALAGRLAWVWFALGLVPMAMMQAAGVSGDGVTNACGLLMGASLLNAWTRGAGPDTQRDYLRFALALCVIPMIKPTHALLAVALVGVQWGLHRKRWQTWLAVASGPALAAALAVGWMRINKASAVGESGTTGGRRLAALMDPQHMMGVLSTTLLEFSDDYLIQLVAIRDVVHRQVHVQGLVIAALYVLLIVGLSWGALSEVGDSRSRWRLGAASAVAAGICTAAVFVALFVTYTPESSPVVKGVQGRYFISLMPFVCLALAAVGRRRRSATSLNRAWVALPVVGLNVASMAVLVLRYYAGPGR